MSQLLGRLQSLHINRDMEDKRIWKVDAGENFSVKSCYGHVATSSSICGPWNEVWYSGIPQKVQFFMWTVVLEKISTMDLLWRKGFYLPNVCLLCYQEVESVSHTLIHCPFSWEIWSGVSRDFGVTFIAPLDLAGLLCS